MTTARRIRDLLHARPFRSFRLLLSCGGTYDISHHGSAIVLKNHLEVGLNLDTSGIAENIVGCPILHITRIEDVPETLAQR